jgi:hypothetical protein
MAKPLPPYYPEPVYSAWLPLKDPLRPETRVIEASCPHLVVLKPVPTTHQRQYAPTSQGLPGVMVLYRVAPALAQLQLRHSLDLIRPATSLVRTASLLANPNSSTSSKTTILKTIFIRTTRSPLCGRTKRVLVMSLS